MVQWVSSAHSDRVPLASARVLPTTGIMHFNQQATENVEEEVRRIWGLLDAHLETRTFLVGERATLADSAAVCALCGSVNRSRGPFRQAFPLPAAGSSPALTSPSAAVSGEVKLGKKLAQFDAKKFAASQPKRATPRKRRHLGRSSRSPRPSA